MHYDSIFGNSVFGGVVTGQDSSSARPIRPGEPVTIGSAVAAHTGHAVLNARGETMSRPITARVPGAAPQAVNRPYQVGGAVRIGFTPHPAGTAVDLNTAKRIAGYVRPAGQAYDVTQERIIAGTVHPADRPYRVGAVRGVGPEHVIYGAGGGQYVPPSYGPRQQGVFHAPPRVLGSRYQQPHAFGPPVIGGGAVGLAGLIGMG